MFDRTLPTEVIFEIHYFLVISVENALCASTYFTYIHTYKHTYLPTYLPTHLPTYLPTYLPTFMHLKK